VVGETGHWGHALEGYILSLDLSPVSFSLLPSHHKMIISTPSHPSCHDVFTCWIFPLALSLSLSLSLLPGYDKVLGSDQPHPPLHEVSALPKAQKQ
jgi:hypothetical protein